MQLPDYYLEQNTEVSGFNDLFHLHLFDHSGNTEIKNIIDIEKSIFVLSGWDIEGFNPESIDFLALQSYIEQKKPTIKNQYIKILYDIAYIKVLFELKTFQNIQNLLNSWFNDLKILMQNFQNDDHANSLLNLICTYLELFKNTNDENTFKKELTKVIELIKNFSDNAEKCTIFCDEKLLSFLSEKEKIDLISCFYKYLESVSNKIGDTDKVNLFLVGEYFMEFFKKSLNLCEKYQLHDLKHEICDYIIHESLVNLNKNISANSIQVFYTVKSLLDLSKFHKNSKEVKNLILLNIIKTSQDFYRDIHSKSEIIEHQYPKEHQDALNKERDKITNLDTNASLAFISYKFFRILEYTYGKTDNEFHFSMIANQLIFDESGLVVGNVKNDEDRYIDKSKNLIITHSQILNYYLIPISEKIDYKDTLLSIQLFKSNDDKHIKNAIVDFLNDDYYGFVVRSVPLIEKKLRLILRQLGEADITENRLGGFDFRPMNAFMSSDIIKETFTEPVQFMFKIIYDDRRGFNLRNKIAHGIAEADEITRFHALLVLFTIIYLANIKFIRK